MFRAVFAVLAAVALAFCSRGASPATAAVATYPSGWNLVAGPEGAHLSGVSGDLYTFRTGDTAYQSLPSSSALHAGWGYWAYFPSGGSLDGGTPVATVEFPLSAGQWVMLGNATTVPMSVTGADAVLTYTAAGGYQQVAVLPAGSGAWVMGGSRATLSAVATAVLPPAAAPSPRVATGHLLTATGQGNNETDAFRTVTNRIVVCVVQSGISPAALFGPMSFFTVRASGSRTIAYVSDIVEDLSSYCKTVTLDGPGSYYLYVGATPWTHWTITVDEA